MEEYGLRGKKLILALIVAGAVAILFRNMGKQMRNQGFEEIRIDTIQNANRAVVALKNKEKREIREDIDQLIQHYLQGEKITQAESISYLEKHKILVGEIYFYKERTKLLKEKIYRIEIKEGDEIPKEFEKFLSSGNMLYFGQFQGGSIMDNRKDDWTIENLLK